MLVIQVLQNTNFSTEQRISLFSSFVSIFFYTLIKTRDRCLFRELLNFCQAKHFHTSKHALKSCQKLFNKNVVSLSFFGQKIARWLQREIILKCSECLRCCWVAGQMVKKPEASSFQHDTNFSPDLASSCEPINKRFPSICWSEGVKYTKRRRWLRGGMTVKLGGISCQK